eukprot:CAMPEP_0113956328 /NCGR_PEP_ID=MMETSP0011_2-20120614/1990_1 /TAXON_ID=101924 /ORGANISM="Rhodosorus marinus" /LENGTH=175 /DNA_ID=CAMNT_0000966441 /DNA_START=779 /DNA_END=1308 /DNA_ORIENTATION=+ /assembly_acc=CAM_ASM_000156
MSDPEQRRAKAGGKGLQEALVQGQAPRVRIYLWAAAESLPTLANRHYLRIATFFPLESARLLARADPRHDRESGSTDEHRSPVMQVFLKTSNLQDAVASQAQRRSKPIPHASPSPIGQMEFSIRPMDDSSTSTTATRPGQTTPQRSREQNRASQEHPHLPFSNDPSKPDPTTNRA